MAEAVLAPELPDARALALELHGLLGQLDPARWQPRAEAALRGHLASLRTRLHERGGLLARLATIDALAPVRDALAEVARLLDQVPEPGLAAAAARRRWKAFRKALLAAYDALSRTLASWDVHVPSLRPTNYARNVLHVASALTAAAVLSLWPSRTVLLAIILPVFVWGWSMEFFRRRSPRLNDQLMRWLGVVAHPHEWHRMNSATWYTTALVILTLLGWFTASLPALVVLGVGDPAAAVIGRRFGRTKLVNGRTLEGSLAFVVAGGLVAWAALLLGRPDVGVGLAGATALAAAVAGAVAELVSRRVDDNLSIPLVAASAAAVVLGLGGMAA
ncbi:MAG: hypothetical protein H6732_11985 [Alphaproteobacteria bacterium]|nr:hypothetical protein [Alphaproteobacteria bacterium]